MLLLMMNSTRASPTPEFGICAKSNASCGLPTFIMIFTGQAGSSPCCTSLISVSSRPS